MSSPWKKYQPCGGRSSAILHPPIPTAFSALIPARFSGWQSCRAGPSSLTAPRLRSERHDGRRLGRFRWPSRGCGRTASPLALAFQQSEQIEALSEQFRGLSENAILSGDLNATPWSATTKRIAELAADDTCPADRPNMALSSPARFVALRRIAYRPDLRERPGRDIEDYPATAHRL